MARLVFDEKTVQVRLAWWEKLLAHHGRIRVSRTAVRSAELQDEWWRSLRGLPDGGARVPDRLYLGCWRHPYGRDFLAVRPRRGPVVCVDLAPSAPFTRLAVTVAPQEGERLVRALDPAGSA